MTAPSCGCERAHEASVQREALRAVSTAKRARDHGRLQVDRAALRRVLGGRDEVIEALEVQEATAKATGRPGANAAVMWRYYVQPALMRSEPPSPR